MGAHFGRLLGIALLAGFAYVPAAHADPHVSIHVGIGAPVAAAPVVVAPAVRPGYAWQPGHYVYTRFGYTWMPGAWVRAPYAYRVEPRRRDWDDRRRWDRDRDRDWNRWRR